MQQEKELLQEMKEAKEDILFDLCARMGYGFNLLINLNFCAIFHM